MGTITRKIHHYSEEYGLYLSKKCITSKSGSFEYDGHRWKYQYTSFDDDGDYDVIFRFDGGEPHIPAEDMTLFDALLCSAVSGLASNPSLYDDVLNEHNNRESFGAIVADGAMVIATEAYRLARRVR